MNTCVVPVSLGELFDKYTILQIKKDRVTDAGKLAHIEHEIEYLKPYVRLYSPGAECLRDLRHINETLWDVEDRIRQKEAAGEFDAEFIDLARLVYVSNDQRYSIKNRINETLGSDIREIKQYAETGRPYP